MKIIRELTCNKCKSTNINIIWKYDKKNEISMLLGHDGWGLPYEYAKIICAECKSNDLINIEVKK